MKKRSRFFDKLCSFSEHGLSRGRERNCEWLGVLFRTTELYGKKNSWQMSETRAGGREKESESDYKLVRHGLSWFVKTRKQPQFRVFLIVHLEFSSRIQKQMQICFVQIRWIKKNYLKNHSCFLLIFHEKSFFSSFLRKLRKRGRTQKKDLFLEQKKYFSSFENFYFLH